MNVTKDAGERLFDACLDVLTNVDVVEIRGKWMTVSVPAAEWAAMSTSVSSIIADNKPGRHHS